eukprot:36627_1
MKSATIRCRQHTKLFKQTEFEHQKQETSFTSRGKRLRIALIVILCTLISILFYYYSSNRKVLISSNTLQQSTINNQFKHIATISSNTFTSTNKKKNIESLPTYKRERIRCPVYSWSPYSSRRTQKKYETSFFVEYLYQFPSDISPQKAEGIIFFAYRKSATDWFMSSKNCTKCIGLPEERHLIRYWLLHNFIVITISSQDLIPPGWTSRHDESVVETVLSSFKKTYDIEALPLYAFGASSGGRFVASFATKHYLINNLNIKGLIVQISAIPVKTYRLNKLPIHIPILYIPMVKDERTFNTVNEQLNILQNEKNMICKVQEKAIDDKYFYLQIDDSSVTNELSKSIYELLKTEEYLNDNGYLIENPTRGNWRDVLIDGIGDAINDNLIDGQSAISEEMNVAFGRHELTAQCNEQMLHFVKTIANENNENKQLNEKKEYKNNDDEWEYYEEDENGNT